MATRIAFSTVYPNRMGELAGTGFHVWADELLEMEKERIVKIERGRVELVA